MRIYTRRGDDGTTSLRGGVRVAKSDPVIEALGALDEAQAALGVARAAAGGGDLGNLLVAVERDLWAAMGEVAAPGGGAGAGAVAAVTPEMVAALESAIDAHAAGLGRIDGFAVPGENHLAAAFDHARTVVRRAERRLVALEGRTGHVLAYVNRLSDLCWTLAREAEEGFRPAREKGKED